MCPIYMSKVSMGRITLSHSDYFSFTHQTQNLPKLGVIDSEWVNPTQCVSKKDGLTVVANEKNKFIPTQTMKV